METQQPQHTSQFPCLVSRKNEVRISCDLHSQFNQMNATRTPNFSSPNFVFSTNCAGKQVAKFFGNVAALLPGGDALGIRYSKSCDD